MGDFLLQSFSFRFAKVQSMRSIQFKHVNSFSDSNGRLLNAMGSLCAQGIYISGNHKTEREDFGWLCSDRTVHYRFSGSSSLFSLSISLSLSFSLSMSLFLPLNIELGWGVRWVGLQLCSFRWEG